MSDKYVEKHLVTINDLFGDFDVDKVHGKGNIKRTYKCSDKKALARKIFLRYLFHLFDEMMEGGSTFVFPLRHHMELRWKRMSDVSFKKAIAAGALHDVDILMSGFACYELVMYYKIQGVPFFKPVKLSFNFRDKMVKKINTGYKYC